MTMDFSRLQSLSHSLNKESDELNDSLKSFESKLASFRLGVEAWVYPSLESHADDDHGCHHTTTLGYSKCTGSWCLTLGYGNDMFPEDGSYTALSQASRELRIRAVRQLPQLLKAIEDAAEKAVKEVEEAGNLLRNIVGRVT